MSGVELSVKDSGGWRREPNTWNRPGARVRSGPVGLAPHDLGRKGHGPIRHIFQFGTPVHAGQRRPAASVAARLGSSTNCHYSVLQPRV